MKHLPQELRQKSLTYKFCLLNISLAYDGITLYHSKGSDYGHEHQSFNQACSTFADADFKEANEGLHKNEFERFDDFHISVIKTPTIPFDRPVRFDDADHDFYHSDLLSTRNKHYHIKFRKQITRDQFILILNLLHANNLIFEMEKESCLNKYDERYQKARDELKLSSNHDDIDLNVNTIMGYINRCYDNDILADLHQYLLSSEYDYLRNCATSSTTNAKPWQGTNQHGEVVSTSECWAKIEKGFALRMAVNVCNNVQLTDQVGQDRAQQLSSTYRFFSIKRKANAVAATNQVYQSLYAANNAKLDASYHKHFK